MEWLKDNWLQLTGFVVMFAAVYLLALKTNQVVRAHNAFVRDTNSRIQQLELQAALWERHINERLADSGVLAR